MQWVIQYLHGFGDILGDLWLYTLVGFLVAGLVDEFVSGERLLHYFGRNNLTSLLRAVLCGFLISACSCGAIPLAATLRSRGASTATTLAFLFASPWLGVPMLMVYVSFLGWSITVSLVGLSLLVAVLAGLVMARLERAGAIAQGRHYGGACAPPPPASDRCEIDGACGTCAANEDPPRDRPLTSRLFISVPRKALALGREIGLFLLIGVFLAALGKAFVPAETVAAHLGGQSGLSALLIAFPVSVAIEACSEGFAVVSGQLYHMGASLAVVFLMTMVGTATDFTELSVVWGRFGRRTAVVYISVGTGITLAFSVGMQLLL